MAEQKHIPKFDITISANTPTSTSTTPTNSSNSEFLNAETSPPTTTAASVPTNTYKNIYTTTEEDTAISNPSWNNINYRDRPNASEYAYLSKQVYMEEGGKTPPPGWRKWKIAQTQNDVWLLLSEFKFSEIKEIIKEKVRLWFSDSEKNEQTPGDTEGYFGAAYVNEEIKHVILAHRGISLKNFGAIYVGLQGILENKVTLHQNAAIEFCNHVIKFCIERKYQLSFTGHNLGGWLALISLYHCYDGLLNYYAHASVTAFDCPGAKEIMKKLKSNIMGKKEVNYDDLDITIYLSYPNLINTLNTHIGSVYHIHPDLPNSWDLTQYLKFTFGKYRISSIVTYFKNNPTLLKARVVNDWPRSNFDDIKEIFTALPGIIGLGINAKSLLDVLKVLLKGKDLLKYLIKRLLNIRSENGFQLPTLIGGEQYTTFYNEFANYENHNTPKEDTLNFRESYKLKYEVHYETKSFDALAIPLRNFNIEHQDVLRTYTIYRDFLKDVLTEQIKSLPTDVTNFLTQYQITDNGMIVTKKIEGFEFRRLLSFLIFQYPKIVDIIEYFRANQYQVIYERMIILKSPEGAKASGLNTNKLESTISDLEKKLNILEDKSRQNNSNSAYFAGRIDWIEQKLIDIKKTNYSIFGDITFGGITFPNTLSNSQMLNLLSSNFHKREKELSKKLILLKKQIQENETKIHNYENMKEHQNKETLTNLQEKENNLKRESEEAQIEYATIKKLLPNFKTSFFSSMEYGYSGETLMKTLYQYIQNIVKEEFAQREKNSYSTIFSSHKLNQTKSTSEITNYLIEKENFRFNVKSRKKIVFISNLQQRIPFLWIKTKFAPI